MARFWQTGDILYKEIDTIPVNSLELHGNLVHLGNDHRHTIEGEFKLYSKEKEMFIECAGDCELKHEEHKPIIIPKGFYKKEIVKEYDHWLEESREVID